jgi:cell division protein FtsQ
MARRSGSTIAQEDLYLPSGEYATDELPVREKFPADSFDDARMLDLGAEQENQFLRGQKRVSVRRGPLPKKTTTRILWALAGLVALGLLAAFGFAIYDYGEHSWRFRIESSEDIQIAGLQNVTRAQVIEVMGADIGRNIFFVPLSQRQNQLQQIPWVESASVMRFVPDRIRIEIHERTPVAFARVGSKIQLIDGAGVLMDLPSPGKRKYSFPVVIGNSANEPLSSRTARMNIYKDLIRQLDSEGAHYSQDLSEVDLSDPDDVKVLAGNPTNNSDGEVLIHLGSSDYLARYKIFVAHEREWREQFHKLDSVDLRYDGQIIVNPDLPGVAKAPPLSAAEARVAMSAGVQNSALVKHESVEPKPAPAAPAKSAKTVHTARPKAGHAAPAAKNSTKSSTQTSKSQDHS